MQRGIKKGDQQGERGCVVNGREKGSQSDQGVEREEDECERGIGSRERERENERERGESWLKRRRDSKGEREERIARSK